MRFLMVIHANVPQVAFMHIMQLYKLNNLSFMRDEDLVSCHFAIREGQWQLPDDRRLL